MLSSFRASFHIIIITDYVERNSEYTWMDLQSSSDLILFYNANRKPSVLP